MNQKTAEKPRKTASRAAGPVHSWRQRLYLLLWALAVQFLPAQAAAAGVEVIVSPDQAGVQIDRAMLRAIFTTRMRQWPDGTPIHVFVLPDDSAIHDQFCREQLGMYPYVLRELWDRLLYTGTGLTPTVVRSETEMRARVRDTTGAIGYTPPDSAATSGHGAGNSHAHPERNEGLAFLKDPS
jgi:hypothetical protein